MRTRVLFLYLLKLKREKLIDKTSYLFTGSVKVASHFLFRPSIRHVGQMNTLQVRLPNSLVLFVRLSEQ